MKKITLSIMAVVIMAGVAVFATRTFANDCCNTSNDCCVAQSACCK